MKYNDAKCRLCRREREKLYLKGAKCFSPKCPMARKGTAPGMHGGKFRAKLTEFGKQLREKQKAKRIYGITESACRIYYKQASKAPRANIAFASILERRADNIVYKAGLAASRSQARQMISHGFFIMNGKNRLTISSAILKEGNFLEIDTNKKESPLLKQEMPDLTAPSWLEVDKKGLKITVLRELDSGDISDVGYDSQSIIEFYSR